MSFRRNRKFKEKPAVFAFGHIMLPLVAILAIGLLILGVRLLFVSPGGQVSYPDTVEYPEAESQAPTVIAEPGDGPQVVAVPSTGGDEPTATPGPSWPCPLPNSADNPTRSGDQGGCAGPPSGSRLSDAFFKESAETPP